MPESIVTLLLIWSVYNVVQVADVSLYQYFSLFLVTKWKLVLAIRCHPLTRIDPTAHMASDGALRKRFHKGISRLILTQLVGTGES